MLSFLFLPKDLAEGPPHTYKKFVYAMHLVRIRRIFDNY
jgi:hypothetical protein